MLPDRILTSLVLWGAVITPVFQSQTALAENIDPDNTGAQYAYGENVGWINAEPSGDGGPGIEVTDSELTGYLWGENIGWVSLSCANTGSCATLDYGVTNDGFGGLAGFAWSENGGWISFSCENTSSCASANYGVTIQPSSGQFSGRAWGENVGWISFRSAGPVAFGVTTSWPIVTITLCDTDGDDDVDLDDIRDIAGARNSPVSGPDDPRDADGDGTVTVLDARQCALQCTLPRCATQ